MGKKLAIKGHPTRGKEVIELLEMMGGRAMGALRGNTDWYTIDEDENNLIKIYGHNYIRSHEFVVLTLEEFWEKYPFKVGDMVVYTKFGDCDDYPIIIKSMKWTGTTIEYAFDGYMTCLAKDLKIWNSNDNPTNVSKMKNVLAELLEHIKTTPKEELEREFEEIKEWSNVGPTVEEFMTFCEGVNKKPKYPKTYDECCKKLNITSNTNIIFETCNKSDDDYLQKYDNLMNNFIKLKICYDAYLKVIEDYNGYKYNQSYETESFFIYNDIAYGIYKGCGYPKYNFILVFPNEDARNVFYDNFKDLIESCKELL